MKLAKRLVSVALALLMAFSCFSLLASAADSNDIKLEFKFYRAVSETVVGSDGVETTTTKWIPTTKVAKGETIKARLFVDTNYAAASSALFWMYPENFLTLDYTTLTYDGASYDYKMPLNTAAGSAVVEGAWDIRVVPGTEGGEGKAHDLTCDGSCIGDSYEPYVYLSEFEGFDWFYNSVSGDSAQTLSSGTEGVDKYGDKYWLYELTFTVNENATADDNGYIKMHPSSIMSMPDYEYSIGHITKQPAGDGGSITDGIVYPYSEDFNWDLSALEAKENLLSVDQDVVFVAGDNGTLSGTTSYTGYIGDALSTIDGFAVPTVTANAGYKLTGWQVGTAVLNEETEEEEITYSDTVITDPSAYVVDYDKTVLKAVYETTAEPTAPYTVNVYEMDVEGNYPADPTVVPDTVGNVNAEVTYTPDLGDAFYVDDKSTAGLKTTVTEDDTDVINVYLARKAQTVKYVDENGDAIADLGGTYYYGKTYDVAAKVDKDGYDWAGWVVDGAVYTEATATAQPATDGEEVTYKASYTAADNKVIINAVYNDVQAGAQATTPFEISAAKGYEIKTGYTVKIVDELPKEGEEEANVTYVLKSDLNVEHYHLVDGQTLEIAVADDGNAVLNLNYDVNEYTVKFLDEDGKTEIESFTEPYLTEIEAPEATDKTAVGKNFVEWVGDDGSTLLEYDPLTVKKNVTYTASYENEEIYVTYIADGEAPEGFTEPAEKAYNYGDTFTLAPVTPETGYTFSGWTVTGHASYDAATGVYTVGTDPIEITGTWTHDLYTITYYLDEGMTKKFGEKQYYYDDPIVSDTPAQTDILGYAFDGWAFEDEDGNVITTATMPAKNLIATASLTAYTVTFYDVYETSVEQFTDIANVTADILPDMSENEADNNYDFVEWRVGSVDGAKATYPMPVTSDIDLYAYGTVDFIYYKDRNDNGEPVDEYKKYTFAFGHEITADDIADLTEPTKTGYSFDGWDNDAIGLAEGHNLAVAQWKPNSYTATFNAVNGEYAGAFEDGAATKTKENIEFNTEFTFTDVPVLAGYTFAYWSEDGVTEAELVMNKEDKTYVAVYTKNGDAEYIVELYLMDAEGNYPETTDKFAKESGTIGTEVSAAHADYTAIIDDFYSADTTSEAADNVTSATLAATGTTLKLYYARAKYAVTVDGAVAGEVYHGGTFVAPAAPEAAEGKEFAGWLVGDKTYKAGDPIEVTSAIELKAQWNDLKYTVTFNNAEGNEISKVENVLHGSTLTADQIAAAEAALPSLEGQGLKYTGWDADTAAAIKADTVITATTAKENYTVKFVTGVDGLTVADLPVTYGEDITAKVETLTADGLNFKSWVADLDTKEAAAMNIADLGDDGASVTYYAYWTANITFVDGDVTETKELDKGANISANAPTFAGKGADYEAGVWYTEADGKGDALAADAVAEANAIYYAYYAPKTNIAYSVEIYEEKLEANKVDGESEYALVATIPVDGATAGTSALYNADREGFIFKNNDPAAPVVASGLVVKAYYDRVDDITITVDGTPKDYEYGAQLNPADPETTEGQEFDKWVDKDGNEVKVPATVTEDMDGLEITATYKYVITFIGFDGVTPVEAEAQPEGELIAVPAAPAVTDYTFQGWYTAADGAGDKLDTAADNVTGVATYYAYYTADTNISYTVEIYEEKLEADKVAGESEYALAETITIKDATAGTSALYNAERTGFTYEKNEPAAPVAASGLVVKAYYTRNLVNVTVNGEDKQVEYGTEISKPTATPPAGQEFDKWVDEDNNEITSWPVIAEEGTVIAPVYKNSEIMITFKDGDKVVSEGTQTFGNELALYAYAPVGYTFEGWYTDAALTDKVEDGALVPATATTYYAKTTVKSFSLSFVVDDETVEGYPKTVDYGTAIVAPEHPDKTAEGYIFAGWFDADGDKLASTTTMPEKDVVYTALYTLDTEPVTYTIEIYHMTLDGTDYELSGSSEAKATIGIEQSVNPGNVKGFTVNNTLSNLKDTVTADGKMVLSIYFARNLYTASFDGTEYEVFYGATLPEVDAPEAEEGKAFAGWVETTSGKKDTEYGAMPDSDLVFESTWTEAVYTITYVVDGEVKEPVEYVYGEKVETPETPTATGMKFDGWSPEVPKEMPAKNLIIVAKFVPNVYTVTFKVDGEVYDKKVIEYDDDIVLPATEPTKDNYDFTGWAGYTEGMKMPAENLTFEASFDRVKVMLIPKNDTCTTKIDRAGGTVDDYVEGESVWYVYGLKTKLKESVLLSEYIDVQGDGRIEIEYRKKDDGSTFAPYTGTGTVINVYDNVSGELVESFYIVIFGDLDGDSYIKSGDAAIADAEALMANGLDNLWSIEGLAGYKPYMLKAANLDDDQIITSTDTALIKNSALGISTIDQTAAAVIDL